MNKVIFLTIVVTLLAFCEGRAPPSVEGRAPPSVEGRAPTRVEGRLDPSPAEACLPNGTACQSNGSWGNCCSGFCYQWAGYSHGFCQ